MKTYRVSGSRAVFGHLPGETFKRDISPAQEKTLIESGAIKESTAKSPDAVDTKTKE